MLNAATAQRGDSVSLESYRSRPAEREESDSSIVSKEEDHPRRGRSAAAGSPRQRLTPSRLPPRPSRPQAHRVARPCGVAFPAREAGSAGC